MAAAPAVELELDFIVWKDKNGTEQTTPAHTIPSGTRFIANQTTAPVGWTKEAVHNDKALRVTSGTVGTGGNSAFNSVFGKTATDNHTLTTAQMPSHKHTQQMRYGGWTGNWDTNRPAASANAHGAFNTNGPIHSAGSGQGHSHGIDLRVEYIDVIIVIKD